MKIMSLARVRWLLPSGSGYCRVAVVNGLVFVGDRFREYIALLMSTVWRGEFIDEAIMEFLT